MVCTDGFSIKFVNCCIRRQRCLNVLFNANYLSNSHSVHLQPTFHRFLMHELDFPPRYRLAYWLGLLDHDSRGWLTSHKTNSLPK